MLGPIRLPVKSHMMEAGMNLSIDFMQSESAARTGRLRHDKRTYHGNRYRDAMPGLFVS